MLKTFCGLVNPPYLISRRGVSCRWHINSLRICMISDNRSVFPVGEDEGSVCWGAWNSAAFGTESSCIATIKLVRGNVYQAALLLKWGHCRQRGALLGGQHCKSLSFAAALFTYYSLYSSLQGPSNPPPPPLCMDHKAKDGIKHKCDFAASPVCCGFASMHDGEKKRRCWLISQHSDSLVTHCGGATCRIKSQLEVTSA